MARDLRPCLSSAAPSPSFPRCVCKTRWRAASKAPCSSVSPSPAGSAMWWGPTWFSVAGWHSSSRTPNALGAAFLFFLMMLMPQGLLGTATLSSGEGGREHQGKLGPGTGSNHTHPSHSHVFGHGDSVREATGMLRADGKLYTKYEDRREEDVYPGGERPQNYVRTSLWPPGLTQ